MASDPLLDEEKAIGIEHGVLLDRLGRRASTSSAISRASMSPTPPEIGDPSVVVNIEPSAPASRRDTDDKVHLRSFLVGLSERYFATDSNEGDPD